MLSVFKLFKADLQRFPSLGDDLAKISTDVIESSDSIVFLIAGASVFAFIGKLQEKRLSYEAYFNPEVNPFSHFTLGRKPEKIDPVDPSLVEYSLIRTARHDVINEHSSNHL